MLPSWSLFEYLKAYPETPLFEYLRSSDMVQDFGFLTSKLDMSAGLGSQTPGRPVLVGAKRLKGNH